MNEKNKIRLCLIANFVIIGTFIITLSYNNNLVLPLGYSDKLVILGVKIDTFHKYILLQLNIFLIEFVYELTYDYANPKLYFLVFNDDKKIINDYSKNELHIYTLILWTLIALKNGIMLFVSISQIDLILSKIIYNVLAYIIVIRLVLNKKDFINNKFILFDSNM